MDKKYYYQGFNGQTQGPVGTGDIHALGEQMKARGETLSYCKEGDLSWRAYEETFLEKQRLAAGRQMDEDPKEFLQRVRGQTCYPTLRALLKFVLVLTIILTVVWMCFAISMASMGFGVFGAMALIMVLLGPVLTIVMAIVAWRLLNMFIDIADTLIEQNRRKRQ